MQSLTDIAIFVKVVELSSFTAAAEALDMSQPVVSKAVTRLEEKLGVRLLNRTTRRLSLTEAGSELYRRSVRALEEIADAESELARFQIEPRGTLRVSAPMSFSILQLGAKLQAFLDRHPGVNLELNLDDRQVDLVEEGFDVAIRIAHLRDSSLVARKIVPCRQVLCASPAYLAKHGTPERPEDLLEHKIILYSFLSHAREWRLVDEQGETHVVPLKGPLQTNNGLVNRAACLAGAGIVMLPSFYLGDQLRSGELVPLLCKFRPVDLAIYAVYPERRNLSPKVRAFVDFLAETFGPEPAWEKGCPLD
ncbi:MAG TPA: LysR family transcriptional regulator [Povalibacter sp.]|uniref:LysR family transcriptional regulator n=1 Tax=Povalibacter sp. TaxID=1962978 RepID=UPI002CE32038|nr:LysR family transcriptional regulator [Povalibacter sp.]HMN43533.1 LysR family transcriptional regulator [Povalibacter sp.]